MIRRTTVLAYHGVGVTGPGSDPHNLFVHPERFRAQMRHLARRRRVVPLDDIVTGAAPAGSVALTFDDGYRHLLQAALPVLEELDLPSTVFVPTAYLGRRNGWDAPSDNDLAIMDGDELREAERRGMRVESHGHAHLDCRTTCAQDVGDDLSRSVDHLQAELGRRPTLLAWPYRDGSPEARAEAQRLGFRAAFSIDLPHAGRFSWGRVQITPRDGASIFALKTSGRYLALRHSPVMDRTYQLTKRAASGWSTR